jgi:NADPH2:quinone reductase
MRAMTITAFGGPEVLQIQDVPEPPRRPHDILVRVHAAALNPVDTKIRSGAHGEFPLPLIPGYDVCGIVEAVGSEVNHRFRVGDYIYAAPNLRRDGSHAELVAVDSRTAALKPKNLDSVQAAALPLVTLTAWEALIDRAQIRVGETILIQAGAGGVGHVAIQLAKLQGCRVIATASAPESISLCSRLGADVVINYAQENVVERVMAETRNRGCPVVFDTVGGSVLEQCMDCVAVNGRVVGIVLTKTDTIYEKLFRKNCSLHLEFMGARLIYNIDPQRQGEILSHAALLAAENRLVPHISKTISLEDLPAAHAEQAAGHTNGKIVVKMAD